MNILCVIPARLSSTRLPRKVLAPLAGKPMIQHTFERASSACVFNRVLIACDDPEIVRAVTAFGGEAVMTRREHESGTSRIAEAVSALEADIIVNVQADEPLVHPESLKILAEGMEESGAELGTLAVESTDEGEWKNPSVVKVVLDHRGDSLYFSRSPVPYPRDGSFRKFLKHLGIYAYKRSVLLGFGSMKPSELERTEQLEQLRFLANGYRIRVWKTSHSSIGVDTPEDLKRVETMLNQKAVGR